MQSIHQSIINGDTKAFLASKHPVSPIMYVLPKIHKQIENVVLPSDSILVTWDVANLYTAIPYEFGIEAGR